MNRKLNWKRDPHLHRYSDFRLESILDSNVSLPVSVDLRTFMPPIVDQGNMGSCTGNAWAYLLGCLAIKGEGMPSVIPEEFNKTFSPLSRLFIYYNERVLEGDVSQDSGASLTDGMNAVRTWGVCQEKTWGYDPHLEFVKPSPVAFSEAMKHKIPLGYTLSNGILRSLKTALSQGFPFVFGIDVFDSFWDTGSNGMVKMPNPAYENLEGGHALCCAGYDDSKSAFIVANSWGTGFGDQGYIYMPYSYLTSTDIASDFWAVKFK